MSADRETNHDMTHGEIALLLAEATEEVEIGTAPYQEVVRGGRRRRARRWAVATAATLVIAGSTGSLALAGAMGGDDRRTVATDSENPTPDVVDRPRYTTLAVGTDKGRKWEVRISVWEAPLDASEARAQLDAMPLYGSDPKGVRDAEDLVGKSWFFVDLVVDGTVSTVVQGPTEPGDTPSGKDMTSYAVPLGDDGSYRLAICRLPSTAKRAEVTWDNGSTTVVHRNPQGTGMEYDKAAIHPVDGADSSWFVASAPEGVAFKAARVVA
ncbi:hypothetical protein [Streptomyces cavernae]|uniref:hypothetical protein n=1 Tax=Streptomyces cavernae TaxID=2259034 RepID=UPI001EE3AA91|nr:hypothetical protein [Streptomyces cavernae]